VIIVDELVPSQRNQPQIYNLVHQLANVGVIRIIFFGANLVWSVQADVCWTIDWSKLLFQI